MLFVVLRRVSVLRSSTNLLLLAQCSKLFTSRASTFVDQDVGHSATNRLHLSPLFSETGKDDMKGCKIELMDDATWHVSSSLADAWRGNHGNTTSRTRSHFTDHEYGDDNVVSSVDSNEQDPDFDEIHDMRIRGKLFYKLDKESKEYEEHKFDFHGKKSTRNERALKNSKEKGKKEASNHTMASMVETARKKVKIKKSEEIRSSEIRLEYDDNNPIKEVGDSCIVKKQRTLTFNQQTAPYHEPFCLDIYISTSSVRASIIHRATSNVVAVAHSISKDMKFDLGSTKNRIACAAVGKVLAQRALADDIHNVVYTPRTGEKIQGKLQIVLKSIINGGVDVKVKLKQKKSRRFLARTHDQHSQI